MSYMHMYCTQLPPFKRIGSKNESPPIWMSHSNSHPVHTHFRMTPVMSSILSTSRITSGWSGPTRCPVLSGSSKYTVTTLGRCPGGRSSHPSISVTRLKYGTEPTRIREVWPASPNYTHECFSSPGQFSTRRQIPGKCACYAVELSWVHEKHWVDVRFTSMLWSRKGRRHSNVKIASTRKLKKACVHLMKEHYCDSTLDYLFQTPYCTGQYSTTDLKNLTLCTNEKLRS